MTKFTKTFYIFILTLTFICMFVSKANSCIDDIDCNQFTDPTNPISYCCVDEACVECGSDPTSGSNGSGDSIPANDSGNPGDSIPANDSNGSISNSDVSSSTDDHNLNENTPTTYCCDCTCPDGLITGAGGGFTEPGACLDSIYNSAGESCTCKEYECVLPSVK